MACKLTTEPDMGAPETCFLNLRSAQPHIASSSMHTVTFSFDKLLVHIWIDDLNFGAMNTFWSYRSRVGILVN